MRKRRQTSIPVPARLAILSLTGVYVRLLSCFSALTNSALSFWSCVCSLIQQIFTKYMLIPGAVLATEVRVIKTPMSCLHLNISILASLEYEE